jgi:hypothetical protein
MPADKDKSKSPLGSQVAIAPPQTDVMMKPPEVEQEDPDLAQDYLADQLGDELVDDVVEDTMKKDESIFSDSEDILAQTEEDKDIVTSEDSIAATADDTEVATSEDPKTLSEEDEGLVQAAGRLRLALDEQEQEKQVGHV